MEQQLLQEQKKPNTLAFRVAISYAIYMIALIVVLRILDINTQRPDLPMYVTVIISIVNWVPFIFGVYYTQNKHKQELGGYITYGRAFSAGFRFSAYAGLFIGIFMFLYYQFLDPAGMEEIVDASIAKAQGDQRQIDGIEMMRNYFAITSAFGAAVMFSLSGLLVSLIAAAFLKKERPLYEETVN